jgi:hypothetical protein
MDDVAEMHKADAKQSIVYDLEKLTLVELNLVLEEDVQVRLNVLHYHADAEVSIRIVWLVNIHEFRNHDVRPKKLQLKLAQAFDQLNFSKLLNYLVFCNHRILHDLKCYQFTSRLLNCLGHETITALTDHPLDLKVIQDFCL